jgi:hypothetical protein
MPRQRAGQRSAQVWPRSAPSDLPQVVGRPTIADQYIHQTVHEAEGLFREQSVEPNIDSREQLTRGRQRLRRMLHGPPHRRDQRKLKRQSVPEI